MKELSVVARFTNSLVPHSPDTLSRPDATTPAIISARHKPTRRGNADPPPLATPAPSVQTARAREPHRRDRRDWILTGSVLAVLLLLALVGDDRHVGLVADGRQMIRTAVAIVETGEIGQARGRDFTFERPEHNDAVSRFGMAMSLLHVPAAIVAPGVEARFGPGSSQALFLSCPGSPLASRPRPRACSPGGSVAAMLKPSRP